ncbi:MAG TPA: Hsp33 family molecular chaperone [Xanthobacteraceae bacterium]|nr:Hsp33 family molecular chaperone [Xanthobacteraceae bacterium]
MTAVPVRRPRAETEDDCVLPFAVEPLDVRGRVVRLGPALDELLANHGYPDAVARLVAEASALGVLLSSTLKFSGRFTLQTQTDGPVDMLVVDIEAPDRVRAYARFDEKRVVVLSGAYNAGALTGKGHLAMTIERAGDPNRYQGIVALSGGSLEDAAHQYFARSEQIPTRVRLAVAEEMHAGRASGWRAGGLLAQFLPREPARARVSDLDPGDAPKGTPRHEIAEDDAWLEAQALVETLEDHELVDPDLSSERLLWRLFNERGVKVFRTQPIVARCRCSRERIAKLLNTFDRGQRADMVEDGRVSVKCEFCGRSYDFDPKEIGVEDV